jgi:hypothetical protein
MSRTERGEGGGGVRRRGSRMHAIPWDTDVMIKILNNDRLSIFATVVQVSSNEGGGGGGREG